MKACVITIRGHGKSEAAAERCIESAKPFGIDARAWDAVIPETTELFAEYGNLDTGKFEYAEDFSRPERVLATFVSHYTLWKLARDTEEEILILEHDAVFDGAIPPGTDKVCSFGKPSFGKFSDAEKPGFHPAFSKGGRYLGGAHAYLVTPEGGRLLVGEARKGFGAADMFLSLERFPWLQEFWPWPVRVEESFTTIQNLKGCVAKHGYDEQYEIL